MAQFQSDRQDELVRVFEERAQQGYEIPFDHFNKQKVIREPEPEWTQTVKNKKSEEYYNKLREVFPILLFYHFITV